MTKIQENTTHKRIKREASPFPAGDNKAVKSRQESITYMNINNLKDPQKKHLIRTVSKIVFTGIFLNWSYVTNLSILSDLDLYVLKMFDLDERPLTYPCIIF